MSIELHIAPLIVYVDVELRRVIIIAPVVAGIAVPPPEYDRSPAAFGGAGNLLQADDVRGLVEEPARLQAGGRGLEALGMADGALGVAHSSGDKLVGV